MQPQNLPRNLRLLLGKYRSLAEGAHDIGINRQQLNKYLNGSSFPSARTLQRIATTLGVDIDVLLADPAQAKQALEAQTASPSPIEAAMQSAYSASLDRLIREEGTLKAYCGDYLCWHRTAISDAYIHASLIRIYQKDRKTYAKSLIAIRRDGQPSHGIKTYVHDSHIFLNAGCLHLVRMSHLAGGETDLGLMILKLPRLPSEKTLHGHTLTTSIHVSGTIVPSKVIMRKVTGTPLQIFRRHCGAWRLDDLHTEKDIRAEFSAGMYVE